MWINRHKLNNSLVVFIHGIFGHFWTTWRGVPSIIQKECERDPLIRSYDMYLFGYDTKFGRSPPLWPDIVDNLGRLIEKYAYKYNTIVLITHSQGGILAKLYLLDMLQDLRPVKPDVGLIITLGCPHRGRFILNPILWLSLGKLFPCKQLGQLASFSSNIRRLKQEWNDVVNEKHATLRSLAVVGSYDIWVSKKSAAGFRVDTPAYIAAPHPGLAKPRSAAEPLADFLLEELRKHNPPKAVFDEIRRISADRDQRNEYIFRYSENIAGLVRANGISGQAVEFKTVSLLLDFLRDFKQYPSRNLGFDDAVLEYARRQCSEEEWS